MWYVSVCVCVWNRRWCVSVSGLATAECLSVRVFEGGPWVSAKTTEVEQGSWVFALLLPKQTRHAAPNDTP